MEKLYMQVSYVVKLYVIKGVCMVAFFAEVGV